jgi:GNAT superfamily N-acetyltransferase
MNNWVERWVSAVDPAYRRKGVMIKMIGFMEEWAKTKGYNRIKSTINNKMRSMLMANIRAGYAITGVELHENLQNCQVFFEKRLV